LLEPIIPQFCPVIAGVDFFAWIFFSEKLEARDGVFSLFRPLRSWPGGRGVSSPAWRTMLGNLRFGVTPKPFLRRRPEVTAESIVDLLSRGVSVAGIVVREADGVARKWRRNGLKRLNPRPEMVWPRKLRTHKMWYTGARLTVRDSG
jgi:hypothetical protein